MFDKAILTRCFDFIFNVTWKLYQQSIAVEQTMEGSKLEIGKNYLWYIYNGKDI